MIKERRSVLYNICNPPFVDFPKKTEINASGDCWIFLSNLHIRTFFGWKFFTFFWNFVFFILQSNISVLRHVKTRLSDEMIFTVRTLGTELLLKFSDLLLKERIAGGTRNNFSRGLFPFGKKNYGTQSCQYGKKQNIEKVNFIQSILLELKKT